MTRTTLQKTEINKDSKESERCHVLQKREQDISPDDLSQKRVAQQQPPAKGQTFVLCFRNIWSTLSMLRTSSIHHTCILRGGTVIEKYIGDSRRWEYYSDIIESIVGLKVFCSDIGLDKYRRRSLLHYQINPVSEPTSKICL